MKQYVLNAIFNPAMTELLIIKKNRPDWQAGKFNLIGGKVEPKEMFMDAAIRETEEETGIVLDPENVKMVGFIKDEPKEHFIVGCFVSITDDIYSFKTKTDESVYLVNMDELRSIPEDNRLENLLSLVELSKSCIKSKSGFTLVYQ